jgi:hypothetical protein
MGGIVSADDIFPKVPFGFCPGVAAEGQASPVFLEALSGMRLECELKRHFSFGKAEIRTESGRYK